MDDFESDGSTTVPDLLSIRSALLESIRWADFQRLNSPLQQFAVPLQPSAFPVAQVPVAAIAMGSPPPTIDDSVLLAEFVGSVSVDEGAHCELRISLSFQGFKSLTKFMFGLPQLVKVKMLRTRR